jgi:hypothetical protein
MREDGILGELQFRLKRECNETRPLLALSSSSIRNFVELAFLQLRPKAAE